MPIMALMKAFCEMPGAMCLVGLYAEDERRFGIKQMTFKRPL
jgi:hypothetical protein